MISTSCEVFLKGLRFDLCEIIYKLLLQTFHTHFTIATQLFSFHLQKLDNRLYLHYRTNLNPSFYSPPPPIAWVVHFYLLQSNDRLKRAFAEPPMVAFRRLKNQKDSLVHSTIATSRLFEYCGFGGKQIHEKKQQSIILMLISLGLD